jgi:hypothetical protein
MKHLLSQAFAPLPSPMTIRLATVIVFLSALSSLADDVLPQFYGTSDPGCTAAFQTAAKADFRVAWHINDEIDIGVGEVRGGIYHGRSFTRAELLHYWSTQARGKFVLITLDKNTLTDVEQQALVDSLSKELFDSGIARVRIHQALGTGVGVLFDATAPKSKKP